MALYSIDHHQPAVHPTAWVADSAQVIGRVVLNAVASVWFGAGALSSLHRPALTVPAAAVKIHGGYLYVARPGDTLWSIASGLQPGGDSRPLVAELGQQLHGAQLVAGDRLTLP